MNEIYDDELSEGFLEVADNMKKYGGIELKDDNTDKGGVAFKGETLQDFLDDLADNSIETLDDVNDVLKDNGIQPIEEDLDDEVNFEEYMGTTTWDKSRDRKGWETYNGKEDIGEIDAYVEYDDNKQKILVTITKYVSKNEDGTLKSEEETKEFTDVEEAINWANEKMGKTKIQESLDTNNKIYKMAQELGKFLADEELTWDVSIYILGKRFHIKDDGTLEYDIDADPRDYFNYVREPNILSMSFEGGLYDVLNYEDINFLDPFFSKYGLFFELGNAWNGSVYTIDSKDDYEWDKIIYNQDDTITEDLDDINGDDKKMGRNNSIKNESIDTKELLKCQQAPREVEKKSREVVDPAYAKASDDINQANDKKEEIVTMEEIPTTEDRFKKPLVNQKGAREMRLTLDENLFEEVDDEKIEKEADSIRKIMKIKGMEPHKSKEDYVKFLKKIHEIRDKNKSLKESKSNILSYHEFVDYLDSINNGYTGFSKVKNDKGVGYRYNLENKLTREQHSYLEQYDNVFFGEAQYKYAPEIKYDTVILLDKMNKIEESKEPRYIARKVNGKGYIYDKKFSDKVPSNVDKDIETARKSVDRWNKEEINEGMKSFLNDLENDEIQYFTHKNRFNYDIKQVRVDNKNKTLEFGQFTYATKLNSTQNGAEFRRLIDELKNRGYKEISKSEETLEESRIPKTKEIKVLQGNYGYGWDDLVEYELDDNTARQNLKDYNENEPQYPHRIIHRRIQNPEYKSEETVNEDIEKTSKGKWVNKGKEGTHGEFKTKKAAREQQKAMYARGFKGESLEENDDIELPTEVTYDFYTLVDDDIDIDSDDYNLDDEITDRLSDDYGYNFSDFDYEIDKKSGDVYVYNIKWDIDESLKRAKKTIKENNNNLTNRDKRTTKRKDQIIDSAINENIGKDIAEYQKWVDYDMKRYGKISEKTNRKVRDARLKIVKDIYGDYEVIANEPIKENKKINEAKEEDNPIKDIRTNVLEFENGGDYIDLYIDYKDGKLIAGMTTNAGIVPEYQIEYDDEKSVDENLQNLYDKIVAEHPEYLETIEERK